MEWEVMEAKAGWVHAQMVSSCQLGSWGAPLGRAAAGTWVCRETQAKRGFPAFQCLILPRAALHSGALEDWAFLDAYSN